MNALVVTIHIIACIALVILVLLQSGKEGMGVIFGGGSSSLFGSSGAGGILAKLTAGAAALFFLTSLSFTYLSTQRHVAQQESIVLDAPAPLAPAAPILPSVDQVPVPPAETPADIQAEPVDGKNAGQPGSEQVESAPSQGETVQTGETPDESKTE
ncbi:MAG: preprotein translocase subunit SecG [Deltaproteobacteria bacterium]|nr:preprotein translocase subunit SecG [Deltaproteobacteria bacterium]